VELQKEEEEHYGLLLCCAVHFAGCFSFTTLLLTLCVRLGMEAGEVDLVETLGMTLEKTLWKTLEKTQWIILWVTLEIFWEIFALKLESQGSHKKHSVLVRSTKASDFDKNIKSNTKPVVTERRPLAV
jgi:hypothetical protein